MRTSIPRLGRATSDRRVACRARERRRRPGRGALGHADPSHGRSLGVRDEARRCGGRAGGGGGGDRRPRRAGRARRIDRPPPLAHASGLPFDGDRPIARPGQRRIYSNTGFEVLAAFVAERAEMAFRDYLHAAVLEPLEMASTRLDGSPASGLKVPLEDLLAVARELLDPRLVAPETLEEATSVAFPGLSGVLPDIGRFEPNDWGLGFELRDAKSPHWTGEAELGAHLRPFRRLGVVPLGRSRGGRRMRGALAISISATGRRTPGRGSRTRCSRSCRDDAAGEAADDLPDQGVVNLPVTARDRGGGHSRHAVLERVPGTEQPTRAAHHSGQDDAELPGCLERLAGSKLRRSICSPRRASVSPGSPASSAIRASSCAVAD